MTYAWVQRHWLVRLAHEPKDELLAIAAKTDRRVHFVTVLPNHVAADNWIIKLHDSEQAHAEVGEDEAAQTQ